MLEPRLQRQVHHIVSQPLIRGVLGVNVGQRAPKPPGLLIMMTYEPVIYLPLGAKDIVVGESVMYYSHGTS